MHLSVYTNNECAVPNRFLPTRSSAIDIPLGHATMITKQYALYH